MRLPDAPAPCADGRWSVNAYRKYVAAHREQVKATTDRETLVLRRLELQCERERHELDVAREKTRNEIREELISGFLTAARVIRDKLYRLRGQLSPVFAGCSPREIYNLWRELLRICVRAEELRFLALFLK